MRTVIYFLICLSFVLSGNAFCKAPEDLLNLNGKWDFVIDREMKNETGSGVLQVQPERSPILLLSL